MRLTCYDNEWLNSSLSLNVTGPFEAAYYDQMSNNDKTLYLIHNEKLFMCYFDVS